VTTHITSDTHLGHVNVIELSERPFPDVGAMNMALIERWNERVQDGDTVYHLGDVVLGKTSETLPLVGLLNGYKILLSGNHDRAWHGHRKTGTWEQRYRDAGFDEVITDAYEAQSIMVGDRRVLICHFPYDGDHTEQVRFEEHRLPDDGHTWLLHGHSHGALGRQHGRQIDVGVDAWGGRPASLTEIAEIIDGGPGHLDVLPW